MKVVKVIIRIIIILIALIIVLVYFGDIVQYLIKPEEYYLGSESMVGIGGRPYSSVFAFIFSRSITGVFAIVFIILSLKISKIKYLLLLLLFVIFLLCWPMFLVLK